MGSQRVRHDRATKHIFLEELRSESGIDSNPARIQVLQVLII